MRDTGGHINVVWRPDPWVLRVPTQIRPGASASISSPELVSSSEGASSFGFPLPVPVGQKWCRESVDTMTGCRYNVYMTQRTNPNSNVVSTVWLQDGSQLSFSHRDTLTGWVNGLKRRGVDPSQVVTGQPGLPESDRV